MRLLTSNIKELEGSDEEELHALAEKYNVPFELVKETAKLGRVCVVNFAAGGIATPADAALMIQLGSDGVFVGSGIYKSKHPRVRGEAIVLATAYWDDPEIVAEACKMCSEKEAMTGVDIRTLKPEELMQMRGV